MKKAIYIAATLTIAFYSATAFSCPFAGPKTSMNKEKRDACLRDALASNTHVQGQPVKKQRRTQ